MSVWAVDLPQLSSCGPIEAMDNQMSLVGGDYLPQLSSCGPIEAAPKTGSPARASQAFRNYQVAAPLKRRTACSAGWPGGILPQLSSCGPIEANLSAWSAISASTLPQLSSCGPIEAKRVPCASAAQPTTFRNYQVAAPLKHLSVCGRGADTYAPSATIKLRPH